MRRGTIEAQAGPQQRTMARDWAVGFDPNALLTLALAAESFDLRGELQALRAPLLMVNSRSDQVFSPARAREFAPLLDAAGVPWSYLELDSDKGHVASGAASPSAIAARMLRP